MIDSPPLLATIHRKAQLNCHYRYTITIGFELRYIVGMPNIRKYAWFGINRYGWCVELRAIGVGCSNGIK